MKKRILSVIAGMVAGVLSASAACTVSFVLLMDSPETEMLSAESQERQEFKLPISVSAGGEEIAFSLEPYIQTPAITADAGRPLIISAGGGFGEKKSGGEMAKVKLDPSWERVVVALVHKEGSNGYVALPVNADYRRFTPGTVVVRSLADEPFMATVLQTQKPVKPNEAVAYPVKGREEGDSYVWVGVSIADEEELRRVKARVLSMADNESLLLVVLRTPTVDGEAGSWTIADLKDPVTLSKVSPAK